MTRRILLITARMFFLIGIGFLGTSCGDDCPGNQVCGEFNCVCLLEPCQVDEDCPQGLVCNEGICED